MCCAARRRLSGERGYRCLKVCALSDVEDGFLRQVTKVGVSFA